jgi:DNA-binding response OmpR family regulator
MRTRGVCGCPPPQWLFGGFRLDLDHACLWREAQAVVLPPKIFAVLYYLVTPPDRLVTKDELLEAVWPETTVSDAVVRVTYRHPPEVSWRYSAGAPIHCYRIPPWLPLCGAGGSVPE